MGNSAMPDDLEGNYAPASQFLRMVASDEVPLSGSDMAEDNLRRLIDFTRDADVSNRDWATFLLAHVDIDTAEVRQALLAAAEDSNIDVRAEALEGLAMRDKLLALPLVERELAKDKCGLGAFEAARLIAHPALTGLLRKFHFPESDVYNAVRAAINACEGSSSEPLG